MAYLVGDVLIEDLYIVDPGGFPYADAAPTVHEGMGPTFSHSYEVINSGGGYYEVRSAPTTEAGQYTVRIVMNDPWGQERLISWDVDALPSAQPIYLESGVELGEIRRMVARNVGDYVKLVATGGSVNTVTDEFGLVENVDHFRGAELICVRGATENLGRRVRATASSFEATTITFQPDLPVAVTPLTEFDVFNHGRLPFRIQQYDQAINDAIVSGFPQNRVKLYMDIPTPLDAITGGMPIPEAFTHIYRVEYSLGDDWNRWLELQPARYATDPGWFVDTARGMITFGPYTQTLNEKVFRIYGYGRPTPLVNDTDRTPTDVEWIIDQASSQLMASKLDQATFAIAQSKGNRADQLRAKMARPGEPNTVQVRY